MQDTDVTIADGDLMERFRAGDRAAYAKTWVLAFQVANRSQFRHVRHRADEIAIRTVELLYDIVRDPGFQLRVSFQALLTTVASRTALKFLRSHRPTQPVYEWHPSTAPSPEDMLDARQRADVLQGWIGRLPHPMQVAMRMKLNDASVEEIRVTLGRATRNATGVFLHRCLARLRDIARENPL